MLPSKTNVPVLWFHHCENRLPLIVATSAERVTVLAMVGM